jgi:hypothetical protein
MLSFLRRLKPARGPAASNRSPRRLAVERLEDRATPANIALSASSLTTSTAIRLTYRASGVAQFDVGIYRSADPILSADDLAITHATITPRVTTLNQFATVPLSAELPLDPDRPYVLAVADPNDDISETNETDNTAQFRKLSLAVITHGFETTGRLPAWLDDMADGLRREGFDRVLEFNWAQASRLPVPAAAVYAGWRMATQVRYAADALGTRPTDVVDVQFIGHSRGSVVISQALLSLQRFPGPRELRLGYFEMTMLDPHPAVNRGFITAGLAELQNGTGVSTIGGFSFDPSNLISVGLARGILRFQWLARDPLVVVPANVDRAEVFYQRLPWSDTTADGFEYLTGFNPWGELPANLINRSSKPIDMVDISAAPINATAGHTSVQQWYIDQYLPPAP